MFLFLLRVEHLIYVLLTIWDEISPDSIFVSKKRDHVINRDTSSEKVFIYNIVKNKTLNEIYRSKSFEKR